MISLIAEHGSNVLSLSMIILVILGAYKWRWTWIWGLFSQVLWSIWIYASGETGFIWMNVLMYVAYSWAHYQWERDRKKPAA
ncbi:hypothetical protein [Roseibium sp. MMSF_3544]|uniref:hypothetical protein n=1 Tax=unclassified Roseibium TaxID=2629323 RepID=UPI00273D90F3|nr:hypothetical protein [Roseibium sp. MMSF_3544]